MNQTHVGEFALRDAIKLVLELAAFIWKALLSARISVQSYFSLSSLGLQ